MLYNDPESFRDDMLKGYVAAYPSYVAQVPGGVVRASEMPENKVVVINGGGSGHYPAFYGYIGDGFMDATVVGNVFTSPSSEDVLSVVNSVNQGTGIFIVGGNYAGDKMNFNIARDSLIARGIDTRSFYITDDVASASQDQKEKRRGNVGTFLVFKAAGAAAAAGYSLDGLETVTAKANDRTRTMSVGFRGCTLPGEDGPLFQVPHGKMEIGQGIHGEPGVGEDDLKPASEVARLLVERVLAEAPADDSKRIAVVLDGLGSTKYEELFVVWGTVRKLLEDAGYSLVAPVVGEVVTSLDMEGIALAVEYLDPELEKLWLAPCDTPAFRRGSSTTSSHKMRELDAGAQQSVSFEPGTEASRQAAKFIVGAFDRVKDVISDSEERLAAIDGVAGDGDHGRGMVKGTSAAYEAARQAVANGAAAGSVMREAGRAWAAKAGGTSGVLWGSALETAGDVVGDDNDDYENVSLTERAVRAAANKIMELGGAKPGDKTMLDALLPFADSLATSAKKGVNLLDAWKVASDVAMKAAEDTAGMVAKVGRARPAAQRSIGTPDAGAISLAMCMKAAMPNEG